MLVAAAEVEEFDLAITAACALKSKDRVEGRIFPNVSVPHDLPRYFYRVSDLCLVISFDASWYAFLDNTVGYNRRPQRWYIPKTSELLARCAMAMQTPEQKRTPGWHPGGRLFFHMKGVLQRGNSVLLTWELPKASKYLLPRIR